MILVDQIYKKIKRIKKEETVHYGQNLQVGKSSLPIGEVANFYRALTQSMGSFHQAVVSDASLLFLSKES